MHSAVTDPHAHLQAQVRWRRIEIAFWLCTLAPFVAAPAYLQLASQIAITALFALSLDLILGYAGIVSLGHAAFFGLGACAAGLQGMRIRPLFETFRFDLYGRTAYTYSVVVLFLTFLVARRIIHSPFGLALRGIRENATRMPAIGAPSHAHLRKIYTLSAAMAGVAGALLAQTTSTVSLEVLSFQRSADVLVILILGGAGRLYGGIVGAIIYMVARDQFS